MIVEQIDAFKNWLTAVLKPICEADPAALAKYVLALIKKDKSEEELRASMVAQLEVFLEGETETFVDLVFQTLESKEYITTPVIPNTNPPNPNIVKPPNKDVVLKENKVIVQPSELPNLSENVNTNISNGTVKKDVLDLKEGKEKREIKTRRNSENEKEDRPPRRRSRHRSLSRQRSRSRSWDRAKRSRSREKSRDREQYRLDREKRERPQRVWRNKSPNRRYERRRSRSPTPPRGRSRSRSPLRHSHRGRYNRGTSRSRSRSMEKRERRDSKDPPKGADPARPDTPTNQEGSDVDARNSGQSGASSGGVGNKRRCRDFDEKGYCMRGEMCPFDHGVDPVVLEDAALSRVLTYNPNGTPADPTSAVLPTPLLTAPAPGHPLIGAQRMPPVVMDNPYIPQAPAQMWRDARFRGPRPMMAAAARLPGIGAFGQPPNHQRELIPVPVLDNKPPEGYAPAPYNHQSPYLNQMDRENMYKKKPFDFNRLGPRAKNPANCSLELKKVPTGLNSITHLNNHFAKFGKIVNIQVQFENDPEAALITFSTHAEANAAYRSTEAVLNNRFIKVFWHNPTAEGKQENVPPSQIRQASIKDRLGATGNVPPNTNKVLNLVQPRADVVTTVDGVDIKKETVEDKESAQEEEASQVSKEDTKAQANAAVKKSQDLLAAQVKVKKNHDEKRKEVLKIQSDLRKRKQELLDKQLSQQKILIDKMSKVPPGPQRDIIKDTIKKTQEVIEGIKKDLEVAAMAVKVTSHKKSKEECQKELLDTELDLIAKQQEGADTSEIQKKLIELRARVGPAVSRGRGRGRGRYTPIVSRHLLSKNNLVDHNKPKGNLKLVNKPSVPTSATGAVLPAAPVVQKQHTVDHRPTRLLVSGYETEEQESVLSHFQQYGEILEYTIDSSLPSITLCYKTRKDAEMAMVKGKHFQDRTLSITWSSVRLQTQRSGGSSTRTVLLSESEEDHLIDQSLLEGDEELGPELAEEVLLQDDEEEEDEERSWRR